MNCKTCRHPNREHIDQQIVNGTPLRSISASSGLSLGSLHRHKNCIRNTINVVTQDESERRGSALLQRVLRVSDEVEKILAAASAKNDFRGGSGALGASAKFLDLCARLSGELQNP